VQWLLHQQLDRLASGLRERGQRLYLDLPLGVNPDGFDVWHDQHQFARGISVGAPPDAFFSLGQDWGFPPLAPEALRAAGYAPILAALRNHLRYAGMLRIDHVMALHRLFWVPLGMQAVDGVYVHYPAEELYAVTCLESARHRAIIVGEDLGTVPPAVRRGMARHGLQRLWVLQFEVSPDSRPPISDPPRDAAAGINTHDMPSFAAFWRALDALEREELGLLTPEQAEDVRAQRDRLRRALVDLLRSESWLRGDHAGELDVLRACLARLAAGSARILLVNLEDLWAEQRPQNVPGTGLERPNWRRKAEYSLEQFGSTPGVVEPLAQIQRLRSAATGAGEG
jgi:4-alpha-glucanotransferase